MPKMTRADLAALFATPRDDHPGRKGPVRRKSSCKDFPRFRRRRHERREAARRK